MERSRILSSKIQRFGYMTLSLIKLKSNILRIKKMYLLEYENIAKLSPKMLQKLHVLKHA